MTNQPDSGARLYSISGGIVVKYTRPGPSGSSKYKKSIITKDISMLAIGEPGYITISESKFAGEVNLNLLFLLYPVLSQ